MSAGEKGPDEVLERLVLDIKAYGLLHGSEGSLKAGLHSDLVNSHDEDVRRFVDALQTRKEQGRAPIALIAIGELVLASFLVLAGTVAFVPNLVGISTPQDLLNYFGGGVYSAFTGTSLAQYAGVLEFVAGLVLLLAAFYTLRQAAQSLKEAGLEVQTSET